MMMDKLLLIALLGAVCMIARGEQTADIKRLPIYSGMKIIITVGYPAQQFSVIFNTGSANTWLAGSECKATFCSNQENKYNSSLSSSHLPDGRLWRAIYGLGAVFEGHLCRDSLSLTGDGFPIDGQLFGQVNSTYGWLPDFMKLDGVVGVGSRHATYIDLKDPIENMYEQGLISQQLFSIYLTKNDDTSDEPTGEIVLGAIDHEGNFNGAINYVPIVNRWTFLLDYVTIPNSVLKYSKVDKARIDSSSNIIHAPEEVVMMVESLLGLEMDKKKGLAHFESCNNLPDEQLNLFINGIKMSLSIKDMIVKLKRVETIICYLGLRINKEDGWILGTPFLRKYPTIFDYSNEQLGFRLSV